MKRNKFSLSHYRLFTCDMGELIPIGLVEVLPGDTIQHSTSLLTRVSPMLAPVMHPVSARIHHWFVPFRLIWEDFEDFITGGEDGMDASIFPTKTITNAGGFGVGTLTDYLGIPPVVANTAVSALPFRAYNLIYNEWYRDQDLQPELLNKVTSGGSDNSNILLQKICWEKDYFTSSRPFTQKGPEITLPFTPDQAPVRGIGKTTGVFANPNLNVRETGGTATTQYVAGAIADASAPDANVAVEEDPANPGFPGIYADLANISATSINDLRLAFALQRYEEARARYGSRYTEYLRYLGVRSSDARLQRPEYLGGGKQTLQFSEVLQTGPDDLTNDQVVGSLKGHGIGALRSNRYRRFFEEHGYVLSLMSVRPKTMYTQGLARTFNRRIKEDFWQRELEHIGQQEVLNKELYVDSATPDGVFGYQDRYDEYRRMESGVAGEFRTTELDFWHMARTFATEPVLNASFVESVPTKRINAVQTNDVLWCMANHSIQVRRCLSARGNSFIF